MVGGGPLVARVCGIVTRMRILVVAASKVGVVVYSLEGGGLDLI